MLQLQISKRRKDVKRQRRNVFFNITRFFLRQIKTTEIKSNKSKFKTCMQDFRSVTVIIKISKQNMNS